MFQNKIENVHLGGVALRFRGLEIPLLKLLGKNARMADEYN